MNDYDKKYFSRFAMDSSSGLDWDDHYSDDVDLDDDDDMVPIDPDIFPGRVDEPLDDDFDFED